MADADGQGAAPLPRLNLALQGGGSHGALTWGVLDALLEDGQWQFDGVSGTSAGAMNAVALAHGFAKAAHDHKDPRDAHQAGCQQAREALTRLWEGVGTLGSLMWGVPLAAANPMLGLMSQWLSPYQTNPLDINPLRRLLEREVDFDLLCAARRTSGGASGPRQSLLPQEEPGTRRVPGSKRLLLERPTRPDPRSGGRQSAPGHRRPGRRP